MGSGGANKIPRDNPIAIVLYTHQCHVAFHLFIHTMQLNPHRACACKGAGGIASIATFHDPERLALASPLCTEEKHGRLINKRASNAYTSRAWDVLTKRQDALKEKELNSRGFCIKRRYATPETLRGVEFFLSRRMGRQTTVAVVPATEEAIQASEPGKETALGAAAAIDLVQGNVVGEYLGCVCTEAEISAAEEALDETSRFAFQVGARAGDDTLVIEAGVRVGGRVAACPEAMINTPDGLPGAPEANVEFVEVLCGRTCAGEMERHYHILLVASADIRKGEALLAWYGSSYTPELLGQRSDSPPVKRQRSKMPQ